MRRSAGRTTARLLGTALMVLALGGPALADQVSDCLALGDGGALSKRPVPELNASIAVCTGIIEAILAGFGDPNQLAKALISRGKAYAARAADGDSGRARADYNAAIDHILGLTPMKSGIVRPRLRPWKDRAAPTVAFPRR